MMADTAVHFAAPGVVSVNVMCYAEAPACPIFGAACSREFARRLYLWGILDHAQHDLRLEECLGQLWVLHQNLPSLQRRGRIARSRLAIGVRARRGSPNSRHSLAL